jgi:hypothetical protein
MMLMSVMMIVFEEAWLQSAGGEYESSMHVYFMFSVNSKVLACMHEQDIFLVA